MKLSRRQFFKGIGLAAAASSLASIFSPAEANASSKASIADGDISIEWLGHGSFLFTSAKGKRILLDPWVSTNPKCPGKYRKTGGFESINMLLWTHGHVDHFMLPDAKKIIEEYKPKVIAPWELNFFMKAEIPIADTQTFVLGNKGATAEFDGLKITMTNALHSSGAQLTETGLLVRLLVILLNLKTMLRSIIQVIPPLCRI